MGEHADRLEEAGMDVLRVAMNAPLDARGRADLTQKATDIFRVVELVAEAEEAGHDA